MGVHGIRGSRRIFAHVDALERQKRIAEHNTQREVQAQFDAIEAEIEHLDEVAHVLARAMMIAAGYHQHKGGEWRKYRERKSVVCNAVALRPGFNHLGNGLTARADYLYCLDSQG